MTQADEGVSGRVGGSPRQSEEERWEVLVGLMRAFPDELALAVPLS
jgi:hypothetical protein